MDQRLKGQEIELRIVAGGQVVTSINAIKNFNSTIQLETKSDGYLGESVNRVDQILNGYGGDFEMNPNTNEYNTLNAQSEDKATGRNPALVFNVIRTDFYSNGQTAVITFLDVAWGEIPESVGGRGEYVGTKYSFICSEKDIQLDNLI